MESSVLKRYRVLAVTVLVLLGCIGFHLSRAEGSAADDLTALLNVKVVDEAGEPIEGAAGYRPDLSPFPCFVTGRSGQGRSGPEPALAKQLRRFESGPWEIRHPDFEPFIWGGDRKNATVVRMKRSSLGESPIVVKLAYDEVAAPEVPVMVFWNAAYGGGRGDWYPAIYRTVKTDAEGCLHLPRVAGFQHNFAISLRGTDYCFKGFMLEELTLQAEALPARILIEGRRRTRIRLSGVGAEWWATIQSAAGSVDVDRTTPSDKSQQDAWQRYIYCLAGRDLGRIRLEDDELILENPPTGQYDVRVIMPGARLTSRVISISDTLPIQKLTIPVAPPRAETVTLTLGEDLCKLADGKPLIVLPGWLSLCEITQVLASVTHRGAWAINSDGTRFENFCWPGLEEAASEALRVLAKHGMTVDCALRGSVLTTESGQEKFTVLSPGRGWAYAARRDGELKLLADKTAYLSVRLNAVGDGDYLILVEVPGGTQNVVPLGGNQGRIEFLGGAGVASLGFMPAGVYVVRCQTTGQSRGDPGSVRAWVRVVLSAGQNHIDL